MFLYIFLILSLQINLFLMWSLHHYIGIFFGILTSGLLLFAIPVSIRYPSLSLFQSISLSCKCFSKTIFPTSFLIVFLLLYFIQVSLSIFLSANQLNALQHIRWEDVPFEQFFPQFAFLFFYSAFIPTVIVFYSNLLILM